MNKRTGEKRGKLSGKAKDALLIAALAFVVLLAAWRLFSVGEDGATLDVGVYTDTEKRIVQMLREMEGVGDVTVTVCETEEGVESVVVVCDGAKDFQVAISVREAVAAAVGTQEKNVKIYLKKE